MSFNPRIDKAILNVKDGVITDKIRDRINNYYGRGYSIKTLQTRYNILKRQSFTGALIPDKKPEEAEPPKTGDKNTIMIPAKITKKITVPPTDSFADLDRMAVHMHNLEAEQVAVLKEVASSLKDLAQTERSRLDIEQKRMEIQQQQLEIQKAMYQKAMEKKV